MKITILPNGNLKMSLGDDLEKFLHDFAPVKLQASAIESIFIQDFLSKEGFEEIKPEDCGALTSATLIRRSETQENLEVWGFLDYQVISFLEELAKGNSVVWQKG